MNPIEIMNEAQANAKSTYLMYGANMEAAMAECQGSHSFPELTSDRALYVGAYMDTIWRLKMSREAEDNAGRQNAAVGGSVPPDVTGMQNTTVCKTCNGSGITRRGLGAFVMQVQCKDCAGSGRV